MQRLPCKGGSLHGAPVLVCAPAGPHLHSTIRARALNHSLHPPPLPHSQCLLALHRRCAPPRAPPSRAADMVELDEIESSSTSGSSDCPQVGAPGSASEQIRSAPARSLGLQLCPGSCMGPSSRRARPGAPRGRSAISALACGAPLSGPAASAGLAVHAERAAARDRSPQSLPRRRGRTWGWRPPAPGPPLVPALLPPTRPHRLLLGLPPSSCCLSYPAQPAPCLHSHPAHALPARRMLRTAHPAAARARAWTSTCR